MVLGQVFEQELVAVQVGCRQVVGQRPGRLARHVQAPLGNGDDLLGRGFRGKSVHAAQNIFVIAQRSLLRFICWVPWANSAFPGKQINRLPFPVLQNVIRRISKTLHGSLLGKKRQIGSG
ncbi:hypothetical protein D3C80_1787820 [compost metagenome]